MGENIVDPPDTQIVTDPIEIEAAMTDTVPAFTDVPEPNILLEDGARIQIVTPTTDRQGKRVPQYRETSIDKVSYDHCSEHPETGEWVYRRM